MIMSSSSLQRGASLVIILVITALSIFMVAFAGLSVWAYMNYIDQKENVDAKISRAVTDAEKKLADNMEAKFTEREKEPYRSFTGPSDYGTLGFKYPKTWSLYIEKDGSKTNGFEAYLNPASVPPTSTQGSRYALRVEISDQQYETTIKRYESLVKTGKLKTTTTKSKDGQTGTRLDGNFSNDLRGAAVIYKIRDKTAIVQTDADTFKGDFDTLVSTITFVE